MNVFIAVGLFYLIMGLIISPRNQKVISRVCLFVLFLLLVCHTGEFKYNYDYKEYLRIFLGKGSDTNLDSKISEIWTGDNTEPLFFLWIKLIRIFLPLESWVYILVYGMTICIPLYLLCKKRQDAVPFSLCSLIWGCGGLFVFNIFSVQRQMLGNVLVLSATYLLLFKKFRYKYPVIIIICIGALLCHNTFFIILPLFITAYFINLKKKKIAYIAILMSYIFAALFNNSFMDLLGDQLNLLSGMSNYNNYMHYLDDVNSLNVNMLTLIPLTAVGLTSVFFYKENELKGFGAKCLITGIVIRNAFASIWLVDRISLLFFIVGFILGLPKVISKNVLCKLFMIIILLVMLFYNIIRMYNIPGKYQLIPYPSIF